MIKLFELIEHTADIGIRGIGKTYAEAFSEAGKAMFSIMIKLSEVRPDKKIDLSIEAENREELLVEFLNQLLFEFNTKELFFNKFELKIFEKNEKFYLEGKAFGSNIQENPQIFGQEVKAATYSGLKTFKKDGFYYAETILDV